MGQFLHTAFVFVHILGVALFVGPQFFLAFGWVAASRQIDDLPTRVRAMRVITRRFLYVAGAGLLMAIVAGTYLVTTWRDYYAIPGDVGFTSLRFGVVFIIKMNVLIVMLLAVGLHTFVVGPQLVDALEAQANGAPLPDGRVKALRIRSMTLSISGLLLALAMMVMGVMLNTTQWSLG